jgi:hypothetical protein
MIISQEGVLELNLPAVSVPDRISMNPRIEPNERRVIGELDGPGCIKHIFMVVGGHPKGGSRSIRGSYLPMANRKMIIRIYFDDSEVPQVEAPVGDFFGVMHGQDWYNIDNHYLSVKPWNGLNCYFHMPFARSARIEIENGPEASRLITTVDWERYPDAELEEPRRFNARWRREMPTPRYGEDFLMMDADGPGQLLGFVYGVRLLDDTDRWSHGGADNIYIDGEGPHPAYLRGIGGEDTFGEGYGGCLHPVESHHNAAMPYYVHDDVGEARVAQRVVGYRFFDNDQIMFQRSLHFRFACMANDICGTVYWYSDQPTRPFAQMPGWSQMLPDTALAAGEINLPLPTTGDWMLSGPYGNADRVAMSAVLPAETEFRSDAVYEGLHEPDSRYLSEGSRKLGRDQARWVSRSAIHNFIDFNHVFRPHAWGVGVTHPGAAVARCVLRSDRPTRATIRVSWDDEVILRVNGEVLALGENRFFRTRAVDVQLVAGDNDVSLKLGNQLGSNHGGWAFAFSATTEDGVMLRPHIPQDANDR